MPKKCMCMAKEKGLRQSRAKWPWLWLWEWQSERERNRSDRAVQKDFFFIVCGIADKSDMKCLTHIPRIPQLFIAQTTFMLLLCILFGSRLGPQTLDRHKFVFMSLSTVVFVFPVPPRGPLARWFFFSGTLNVCTGRAHSSSLNENGRAKMDL